MATQTQTLQRTGLNLSVYLILWKREETLMLKRRNTGYCDRMYGLVAGHLGDGESALQALVREAQDEADIKININDVMHRQSNRFNIDLFLNHLSCLNLTTAGVS